LKQKTLLLIVEDNSDVELYQNNLKNLNFEAVDGRWME
jgi:hypothetical protein